MELPASGTSFSRDHPYPTSADTQDFKLRNSFDGGSSLRGVELPLMTLKHSKAAITLAQVRNPRHA